MNKKYQQLVPILFLLSLILTVVIIFVMCQVNIKEYFEVLKDNKMNQEQAQQIREQQQKEAEEKAELEMKLKSLKPIYKSEVKSGAEANLSVFGTMFEDVINKAKGNGLLIRSIEYNMNPTGDLLYSKYPEKYNACEVKFFFVSTYNQLLDFLNDMNMNFEYLTSISELKVTAFQENTDYVLINVSIILYSSKEK